MQLRSSLILAIFVLFFATCSLAIEGAKNAKSAPDKMDSYMKRLSREIRNHWSPPKSYSSKTVVAKWKIHEDGSISDLKIIKHGLSQDDDQVILDAVTKNAPFESLPLGTHALDIQFDFDFAKPKPLNLTVAQAIEKYSRDAKKRLLPCFDQANVNYPPKHLDLVCLKQEQLLLAFAVDRNGKMKQIKAYTVVSSSGVSGPKLKEGDLQVPEGFYKITRLDAMTHLAMWVNYPNLADRTHAKVEHRNNPGGNIQIHGGVYSTGCIVITNDDMAELLTVGNDIGCNNVDLIIAPCNLLSRKPKVDFTSQPKWLPDLYKRIAIELRRFPITI